MDQLYTKKCQNDFRRVVVREFFRLELSDAEAAEVLRDLIKILEVGAWLE